MLTNDFNEYINMIIEKINLNFKNISVVMATGTGTMNFMIFLADRLCKDKNIKITMLFTRKMLIMQMKDKLQMFSVKEQISVMTVKEFMSGDIESDYIIGDNLCVADRNRVLSKIRNKDTRYISFFAIIKDSDNVDMDFGRTNRMIAYYQKFNPTIKIYSTNEILDIRDIRSASNNEDMSIRRQLIEANNDICRQIDFDERDREKLLTNRQSIQYLIEQINKGCYDFIEEDEALEQEFFRVKPATTEKNSLNEILLEQVLKLNNLIQEKNNVIEKQNQMLIFNQEILKNAGINVSLVEKFFGEIQDIREMLKEELSSRDEEEREIALKILQDKVAECIGALTENHITVADNKYYEEYLIGELSSEVWEMLDKKSKTYLITAKSNYDCMKKMKDCENLDYSGVCLLVTKALEVETTKRFFEYYKMYLSEKYESIGQWPKVLRKRYKGEYTKKVIEAHKFTLGSVVSVIGLQAEKDKNGNIRYSLSQDENSRKEFLEYASLMLFKSSEIAFVKAELEKDYKFVEKVRIDYRNPAAHKGALSITSAQNCMEYVIEIQHMLKEMLSSMKK